MRHGKCLAAFAALLSACMGEVSDADVADAPEVEVAPLMTIEVAPQHTVELYDLGGSARIISEGAPSGVQPLIAPREDSFVAIFKQLRPGEVVPEILVEADSRLPEPQGVGVKKLAVSTEEWRQVLGGCVCPIGSPVYEHDCNPNRTGDYNEGYEADWAWFNLNSIEGDGFDAHVTCNGKTVRTRYNTNFYRRIVCEDKGGLFSSSTFARLRITGVDRNVDRYDLSACWIN